VAGFDETGPRVADRLHWVHCARTGKYILITCHSKRGKAGIDAAGVLGQFRGTAVHDAWAPYDTYLDVTHQLLRARPEGISRRRRAPRPEDRASGTSR
jgi:transposase